MMKSENSCSCGCGQPVKGLFGQGHDARLKSLLNAVLAGERLASEIPAIARQRKAEIGFLKGKGNRLSRAFSVKEAK